MRWSSLAHQPPPAPLISIQSHAIVSDKTPITENSLVNVFQAVGCFADASNDRVLTLAVSNCPEGERAMSAQVRITPHIRTIFFLSSTYGAGSFNNCTPGFRYVTRIFFISQLTDSDRRTCADAPDLTAVMAV